MANTVQSNDRVEWTYTSSEPTPVQYSISAKDVYVNHVTDGAKYGGTAGDGTKSPMPKNLLPRRVKCKSSGLPDKWVIAYTTVATIWTTPDTSLTLNNNGVDATYTTTADRRAEKWVKVGTRQST